MVFYSLIWRISGPKFSYLTHFLLNTFRAVLDVIAVAVSVYKCSKRFLSYILSFLCNMMVIHLFCIFYDIFWTASFTYMKPLLSLSSSLFIWMLGVAFILDIIWQKSHWITITRTLYIVYILKWQNCNLLLPSFKM